MAFYCPSCAKQLREVEIVYCAICAITLRLIVGNEEYERMRDIVEEHLDYQKRLGKKCKSKKEKSKN